MASTQTNRGSLTTFDGSTLADWNSLRFNAGDAKPHSSDESWGGLSSFTFEVYEDLAESSLSNSDRFKYAGMQYDAVIGLAYDNARWYSPASGRFVSQDPIGFAGGDANLYRYVGNSPENFV